MEGVLILVAVSIIGPLLGSAVGVLKKPSDTFMYNMLAFAAGVMLAISFMEMIPESIEAASIPYAIAGVVAGAGVMALVDRLLPHIHPSLCSPEQPKLKKTAVYLLWGIFLHNFPEGMAIGFGTSVSYMTALTIAVAITIHDIPEGICTSSPYYYATGKRLKAFLLSATTTIPTLVGFGLAYYLTSIIPPAAIGFLMAATAGLMIYISADELIPASCCQLTNHQTIYSLIIGIITVVALSGVE